MIATLQAHEEMLEQAQKDMMQGDVFSNNVGYMQAYQLAQDQHLVLTDLEGQTQKMYCSSACPKSIP